MSCINKNHPEFRNLVKGTNQNPTILAAYVNMWMERVDNTRFPNTEEISRFVKEVQGNSLFYNLDSIKEIAVMFGMDTKGFFHKQVNPTQLKAAINRKGIADLEVKISKFGSPYLVYKKRFINPFRQYQLDNKQGESVNNELATKLKDWAGIHGIKIEAMEEMLARFSSQESNMANGAVALADLLNKIIAIDPLNEKIDTLAEEISHFATAILKGDASVKRAMDSIENTEIYKRVKEQYKNAYSTEEQFKKEAVDKLLAQAIIDKFQKTEENKGFIAYLKAIFDKFWKWVNGNLKNTNAERDIKESLYPIAQKILNNEYLGELTETETGVFYQLEEEADSEELKQEAADSASKSEIEIAKEFLINNLNILNERLDKLTRQSGVKKQSTIDSLQNKIIKLKVDINSNKLRQGIIGMVDLATVDLEATNKVLQRHLDEKITHSGNVLDSVKDFNDMYKTLFINFQQDMDYYNFNPKLREQMNSLINGVITLIGEVERKNDTLIRKEYRRVLVEANTGINGEKIDKDFDEKAIFDSTKEDISAWRLQVGNFKNAKSFLVRAVFKIIHNSNNVVKRKAIEVAQELAAAQVAMEKSGIKQKDLIEVDSNGVPTQYLIREKNWAPFIQAKSKMQEDLTKTLKFQTWEEVYNAFKKEELNAEQKNIYINTLKEFSKKFPLETVRDSEGNFAYKQPKEINPRFAEIMSNPFAKNYYDLLVKHKREAINKLPLKYRKEAEAYSLPGIRAQFIEKLFRKDVSFTENIKDIAFESLFRDQDDTEFGDEQTTLNNKVVPIFFTNKFRGNQVKALSTDLTRSFTIFAEMAESFREKNKIAGDISTIQTQLGKRNRGKSIGSNEHKAITLMLNTRVYGLEKKDIVIKVGKKNFSVRKLTDNLTRFIRNNNLALNLATSTAGYLKGNIDTLIEDQLGEYTTVESKNWARLEYTKSLAEVMSQIGSKKQTNKMHLLLRRNRVVEINSILTNTERGKLTSSVLNSEMLYLNYKTGDYGLKGRVALAVYHNTRLVDGKFLDKADFRRLRRTEGKDEKAINSEWKSLEEKNLYNAFEVVDAQLVVKKEFEQYVSEGLENKVQGIIEYTANTIDGTMSETDKGALAREIGGGFLLMHRGWLINMIDSRGKPNTKDLVTGKEEMGYYPATYQYFRDGLREEGLKNIMSLLGGSYWKKMKTESPGKTKGVKKALLDFLYLNIIGFLAALVNVAADADDDEEDFTLQFSAYILNRTLLEHTSGNPALNYSEILQIIDEPVVGVRMVQDLLDFTEMFNFGDVYESGMYKGRSHAEKWWMKKWPGKNLYELQFPEMKNRFIKTQVLNSGFYKLMKEDDEDEDEGGGLFNRFKALLISDSDISPTEAYNGLNEDYDDSK